MTFENLTRQSIVKFFTRNKRKTIVFPIKTYFWDNWTMTEFQQEPLINNILSCILYANDKLQYDQNGNISEEYIEEIKTKLHDQNLQQTYWSKKKIFECINIGNINNDFFLFLCKEFYINIIICSEIGIKIYYMDEEFDKNIPTIILKSLTDDITKQVYYQHIYNSNNKLLSMDELSIFLDYPEKYIIGLEKNKKLIIKNYSLIEKDDDVVHMEKRRELDNSDSDNDLYNEFEEI